jgi:hypothetical protein
VLARQLGQNRHEFNNYYMKECFFSVLPLLHIYVSNYIVITVSLITFHKSFMFLLGFGRDHFTSIYIERSIQVSSFLLVPFLLPHFFIFLNINQQVILPLSCFTLLEVLSINQIPPVLDFFRNQGLLLP